MSNGRVWFYPSGALVVQLARLKQPCCGQCLIRHPNTASPHPGNGDGGTTWRKVYLCFKAEIPASHNVSTIDRGPWYWDLFLDSIRRKILSGCWKSTGNPHSDLNASCGSTTYVVSALAYLGCGIVPVDHAPRLVSRELHVRHSLSIMEESTVVIVGVDRIIIKPSLLCDQIEQLLPTALCLSRLRALGGDIET